MMAQKNPNKQLFPRKLAYATILLMLAAIGTTWIASGRAAVPATSFEPESAILTGNSQIVSDASASSGKAVQFTGVDTMTPMPVGVSGTWSLAFEDEFNGSSLDTTKWNLNEGKKQNGVTNSAANSTIFGGSAVLTLASATSGAMLSSGPVDGIGNTHYQLPVNGYAEARIYFAGSGTTLFNWPAWWLVGSPNWPAHGENDIAEVAAWKTPSVMSVNYHGPGSNLGFDIAGIWSNAYHVYGAHRKASSTDFYFDGNLVKTLATSDDDIPQSLVFNNGLYSGQTGTFGAAGALKVDYVRAWQ